MATIKTYNGFAINFDNPKSMESGVPVDSRVVITSTSATVPMSSGSHFVLHGTGFSYNPFMQTGSGTVTSIQYFRGDTLLAEATGTNFHVPTVLSLAKQEYGGSLVLNYAFSGAGGERYELSSGNDIIHNTRGNNFIDGGDGYDTVSFSGVRDSFTLTRDADGLISVKSASGEVDTLKNIELLRFADGNLAADEVKFTINESFVGGTGAHIDGGTGVDVVSYTGARSSYTIQKSGDTITVSAGGSVANVLVNVERLQFADGVLALDIDGNAGQVYRLYQAALERTPDLEGLKYWIGKLDAGDAKLDALADSFLHSPEFRNTYGDEQTVSNSRFVELLYTHTLGREYDQEGHAYWVGKLDANATTRRDLLAFFSESNENKSKVFDAISDGIWLS